MNSKSSIGIQTLGKYEKVDYDNINTQSIKLTS